MTAAFEREAVGTVLQNWAATPISWPNRDFTPPESSEWIAVSIRAGDSQQIEIGSPTITHRHSGLVYVQIFSPIGKGDKAALDIADQIAALFRRYRQSVTNGGIVFRTPTIRAVGVDGAFFQVNVSVPYVRDFLF